MVEVNLNITKGLPYSRRIRVTDGKLTWPTLDELEVKSDVRVSAVSTGTLKGSLAAFITPSFEGNDLILELRMSGKDTRTFSGGFYDIVVSDKGTDDIRAIRVLKGRVEMDRLVTGE